MIVIGFLTLVVALVVLIVRMPGPKLYLGLAVTPVVLVMVQPVQWVLSSFRPTELARPVAMDTSSIGLDLSVILSVVGVVLTARAVKAGDRRGAKVLALETILAAMPAAIVTASAAMFRFL